MNNLGYYDKLLVSLGWKFQGTWEPERVYCKQSKNSSYFWLAYVNIDKPNTMPTFRQFEDCF